MKQRESRRRAPARVQYVGPTEMVVRVIYAPPEAAAHKQHCIGHDGVMAVVGACRLLPTAYLGGGYKSLCRQDEKETFRPLSLAAVSHRMRQPLRPYRPTAQSRQLPRNGCGRPPRPVAA